MFKDVSIVIPVNNEGGNIAELCFKLSRILEGLSKNYEVIFVDDGSSDNTYAMLLEAYNQDKHINIIKLTGNFGQSTALSVGFCYARGRIIITMDGDLQHDPEDIPLFLDRMNSGCGLVNGWKRKRNNDSLVKRISRLIFKIIMRLIFGVQLNNSSSTFKAYRWEDVKGIALREGLHCFMPVIMRKSISICEIEIKCNKRKSGKSHYGWKDTIAVCQNMFFLMFNRSHILNNYSLQDRVKVLKFHA